MSGHSKWSTIKRQKGLADTKRSATFGKLARQIAVAARDGKDPEMNFKLRLAIDRAKAANLPNDNIDRAILVGSGEARGEMLKELTYEGFGPGQVAVIVQALTDNTNRTAADIRSIFSQHGGTLGGQNSVAWMFSRRGMIRLPTTALGTEPETVELGLIDAGADDVQLEESALVATAAPEKLHDLQAWLSKQSLQPEETDVTLVPTTTVQIDDATREKLHQLFTALDDHDDVTAIFSNEQ